MRIETLDRKNLAHAKEALKDAFWREGKNSLFNEWEFAEILLNDRDYIKELCLIAIRNLEVVGYNALTPAMIGEKKGLALGPLGVKKNSQRQGIGKTLVKESIRRAKKLGYDWIVLLGGEYYAQFSFESAMPYGVFLEKDSPENKDIQILFLNETSKSGLEGKLVYCDSFYDEDGQLL
ncbi:MAG: N-acetyltransferase [Clostridiales bacterium]|nr:N-acetyltransferase [Clostridiales bacterium]